MSEARKALRAAVRGAWDTDPNLIAIQDELTKKGYNLLHDGYKECVTKGTKPIKQCYRDVASAKKLSEEYRSIWGAK
ncbi:hypothetical protein DRO69_05770 [Candidatus Bathyarchaeota archaeon]|nr:MAG: hypothetical protein DRO69_05770 [Candidatus Bathyarchaeota archaeon]